jgi:hypothetical protein
MLQSVNELQYFGKCIYYSIVYNVAYNSHLLLLLRTTY